MVFYFLQTYHISSVKGIEIIIRGEVSRAGKVCTGVIECIFLILF